MTTEERLAKVERELADLRTKLIEVEEYWCQALARKPLIRKRLEPRDRNDAGNMITLTLSDTFTYTKPVRYSFLGQEREVRNWNEFLLHVCRQVYDARRTDFAGDLGLWYLSRSPANMRTPEKVADSGIYVETFGAANTLRDRCREVLGVLGFRGSELTISARKRDTRRRNRRME